MWSAGTDSGVQPAASSVVRIASAGPPKEMASLPTQVLSSCCTDAADTALSFEARRETAVTSP